METQPTIRAATPTDLAAVLGVLAENESTMPDGWMPLVWPRPTDKQSSMWDRVIRSPDVTVYLAEVGREAVGTACLSVLPNVTYDCRPTAFIEAVVIKYRYRRRGIGRAILDRILTDAYAAGCYKIQLLTHKRHAADGAHDLYRSAGFVDEAEGFRLYLHDVQS